MALSRPCESVMPLAVVEMACCSIHTFSFRLPLMNADRASDWNNTQRCHDHLNCCHYWPADSSMNLAPQNAGFLGTMISVPQAALTCMSISARVAILKSNAPTGAGAKSRLL